MEMTQTIIMSPLEMCNSSTMEGNVQQFCFNNGETQILGTQDLNKSRTCFIGVSSCPSFAEQMSGSVPHRIVKLLIRAINNRTIERNYFKLYSDLLDNAITEEEFDNELVANESNYVINNDYIPTEEELKCVLKIVPYIKNVKDSEDLSSLFSFNSNKLDQLLLKLDKYNDNIQ